MMFAVGSRSTPLVVVLLTLCLLAPPLADCYVQRRASAPAAADSALLADELGDMLVSAAAGDDDPRTGVGRPRRPESFRTIDELNEYLAEMRQYYSMLGRPRSVTPPRRIENIRISTMESFPYFNGTGSVYVIQLSRVV